MSKDITIKKDGVSKTFEGVSKIQVHNAEGKTENWYPDDEQPLGEITITENGDYDVSATEYYGFETVIVNVPPRNQVTGKFNGQYCVVTVEDGTLVYTDIPMAIQVTTPPDKTAYNVKEYMDFTGIVVELLDADGEVFTNTDYSDGEVPFSELSFPQDKAYHDSTHVPVNWINPYTGKVLTAYFDITVADVPSAIAVSLLPTHEQDGLVYQDGDDIDASGLVCDILNGDGSLWENEDYPYSQLAYNDVYAGGYHIKFGELTISPTVAQVPSGEDAPTVTVTWVRPDEEELTTEYEIEVE